MPCISPIVRQIWVVSAILVMVVGHGMVIGITSSMLPALQAADSLIKVDLEQVSWLSASVGVGSTMMYFGSTYFMATYGRRGGTLLGLLPAVTGPLICYFFSDINVLIFGRFLSGMGVGAGLMGAIVIGEYTSPRYRGVFLNFKSAALYVGSTIVHIIGNYFHWRTVTLIVSFVYAVSGVMIYTWPESPAWLASQRKYNECTKYFYWLRGNSVQATQELGAMITAQKERPCEVDTSFHKKMMLFLKKFTKKNFVKPLWIYFFVAILLETSGRHVFPAYALNIIYEVDPDPANAFYYTLGIDLLMTSSAIISTVIIRMMKRRTLLFYSGVSSVVVLLSVCAYYYLQSLTVISKKYDSVAIFLFGLYFGVVNIGCTPVCLTLLGEIFPLEHRPTGVAISGVFISIFMVLTLKITPLMLDTIKIYGTFAVYGISMAVCLFILLFTLPETKDKTLQEIEDYVNDNSIRSYQIKDQEQASLTDDDNVKKIPERLSLYLKE